MEILEGFGRFDRFYDNAYYCKNQIDKSGNHFDLEYAKDDYINFLNNRLENPTIADTAMRKVVKQQPYKNPEHTIINNLGDLESVPEIDKLVRKDAKNYHKTLYPKTGTLRQTLIENDRIALDTVTPKLTGLKKLLLRLKVLF